METTETPSRDPNSQSHSADTPEPSMTVGQRIDRICNATQTAWNGGCEAVREVKSVLDIDGRVDRNPYTMMAAAAGSGYVLGGGVFTPLTARIVGLGLRLGLRLAAIPLVQRELLALAAVADEGSADSETPYPQTQPANATSKQQEMM